MVPEQRMHLDGPTLVTGGTETTLHFQTSFNLREMASFETLLTPESTAILDSVIQPFLSTAVKYNLPLIIETQTYRASQNWFEQLDTLHKDRKRIFRLATRHARNMAAKVEEMSHGKVPTKIQGIIGPMRDGYKHGTVELKQAREYHAETIQALQEAGVDMVAACTMTGSIEAEAIAHEAGRLKMPLVVSFTLERDGRLPSGELLAEAVERIDSVVSVVPIWYEVNCVHPRHIEPLFEKGGGWVKRVRGVRCNASSKSHEELDGCDELDRGVAEEWAKEVVGLRNVNKHLMVLGGCCGTDGEHCEEIAKLITRGKNRLT